MAWQMLLIEAFTHGSYAPVRFCSEAQLGVFGRSVVACAVACLFVSCDRFVSLVLDGTCGTCHCAVSLGLPPFGSCMPPFISCFSTLVIDSDSFVPSVQRRTPSYQRLEFLGDALIELLVRFFSIWHPLIWPCSTSVDRVMHR